MHSDSLFGLKLGRRDLFHSNYTLVPRPDGLHLGYTLVPRPDYLHLGYTLIPRPNCLLPPKDCVLLGSKVAAVFLISTLSVHRVKSYWDEQQQYKEHTVYTDDRHGHSAV